MYGDSHYKDTVLTQKLKFQLLVRQGPVLLQQSDAVARIPAPLAKILATASCRSSKAGPSIFILRRTSDASMTTYLCRSVYPNIYATGDVVIMWIT